MTVVMITLLFGPFMPSLMLGQPFIRVSVAIRATAARRGIWVLRPFLMINATLFRRFFAHTFIIDGVFGPRDGATGAGLIFRAQLELST